MSINTLQPASPIDQLARSLVDRFDVNKDGTLSTGEFTSFLSNFLNAVGPNANAAGIADGNAVVNGIKGGGAPKMLGFNAAKLADAGHLTIKYRFGRVAQGYSLDSVKDKASAETLLRSMADDLKAAGLPVLDVKGDKILIKDAAGHDAWFDVIYSAGSGRNTGWQFNDTRA
jgi:hypothetical protein